MKKTVFLKRVMAVFIAITMTIGYIAPIASVFAASTTNLTWSTSDGTNLCNFSDPKSVVLSVNITTPTSSAESIQIVVPSNLKLAGHTDTAAAAYTTSITQSGNTLTLNLKPNITGTFTEAISVNFDENVSWNNVAAVITATQYDGGAAAGTPANITLTEYNNSLPNISYVAGSATVSPDGYAIYTIGFSTYVKKQGASTYALGALSGSGTGINFSGTLTIPLPSSVTGVTFPYATGTANYDAANNKVIFTSSRYNNTSILQLKVKFDNTITAGSNVTMPAASFTGTTSGGLAIPTTVPLYAAIGPITQSVVPVDKTLSLSLLPNATNTFLIGENTGYLYNIGLNNSSPVDYPGLQVSVTVPDGMYCTGISLPAGALGVTQWAGNVTMQYDTNQRPGLSIQTTPLPSSNRTLNAASLGLTSGEYITNFTLTFDNFRSKDTWNAYPYISSQMCSLLGYVGTTYRNGTPIQNNDPITLTATASLDGTPWPTVDNKNCKYTVQEIAGAGGRVDLVNSSDNAITNNNFYPGDTGRLRIILYSSNSISYMTDSSNTKYLRNPIVWVVLPTQFALDTANISIVPSAGVAISINSITPTSVNVGAGKKLWRIDLSGSLDKTVPQSANIYLPFKVDNYAMPGAYTIGNGYYVSSSTQVVRGSAYIGTTVSDTYDFNQNGSTIDTLSRIDIAGINNVQSLNVIISGFNSYHTLTSALSGVAQTNYTVGDNSTISHFSEGGTGTYNVAVSNSGSLAMDQYVSYQILPNDTNVATPDLMLTGPIASIAGFDITYTTAAVPEENELTGGIDTTYVPAGSISDWTKVTGFKIKANADIAPSTTVNIPVNVRVSTAAEVTGAPAANYYRQVRTITGDYYARQAGDAAGTSYQMSQLAFDIQNRTLPPTIALSETPAAGTWTNNDATVKADLAALGGNVIVEAKWASGTQTAAWFAGSGNALTGIVPSNPTASGTFLAPSNGVYTVYTKDDAGLTAVQTITISNIDKALPTIAVTSASSAAAKSQNITITAADSGGSGLLGTNVYEYQLSTSNTVAPTGTWKPYTSGTAFTEGAGLTGTYYIWVKTIKDVAGNSSAENAPGYTVSGPYIFDNT
ncbi:MAG: hypothetical protein FWC53_00500, partial [Firmicutes bacterium]|nr:hypothetical protein [Bacillota bacterium]